MMRVGVGVTPIFKLPYLLEFQIFGSKSWRISLTKRSVILKIILALTNFQFSSKHLQSSFGVKGRISFTAQRPKWPNSKYSNSLLDEHCSSSVRSHWFEIVSGIPDDRSMRDYWLMDSVVRALSCLDRFGLLMLIYRVDCCMLRFIIAFCGVSYRIRQKINLNDL